MPTNAELSDRVSEIRTYIHQPPNYTTGLAHIILAGTSGWAIHAITYKQNPIAFSCFVYLMGHGLLGILSHTHPHVSIYVKKLYYRSFSIAQTLPLALINIQMYHNLRQPSEYITCIALSAAAPILWDIILPAQTNRDNSSILSDIIQITNSASLGYISTQFEKYWAFGLAILCGFNHFAFKILADKFNVPNVDLHTIGLGFLTIFAVNAITE